MTPFEKRLAALERTVKLQQRDRSAMRVVYDNALENIDQRFDAIDERLDAIDKTIEDNHHLVMGEINTVTKSVALISQKLDALRP